MTPARHSSKSGSATPSSRSALKYIGSRSLTCAEFAEILDNIYHFDEAIDRAHWTRAFRAEDFFDLLKWHARQDGVELTDVAEFDYETYFWRLYSSSEKGLS